MPRYKEEPITREAASKLDEIYKEILDKESHHNHELIMSNDILRWKRDQDIDELSMKMGINEICEFLQRLGYNKNSEIYRKWYRSMGYSLSGYWEIFYREENNEEANDYIGKAE